MTVAFALFVSPIFFYDAEEVVMSHSKNTPPRRDGRTVLPPALTLAAWRVRRTWRLLLITGLGMLAGVMLVCTAPLFSQVTLTAGLRNVLTTTPQDAEVLMQAQAKQLSIPVAAQNNQMLGDFMRQQVGSYLSGTPHFSIQPLPIHVSSFRPGDQLQLIGDSMQASAAHIKLIGGRLPQDSGGEVEIALTPGTAGAIHVTLGQEFTTII